MTTREKLAIGGGIAVIGALLTFRKEVGSGIVAVSEKAMAALKFIQTEAGVQKFAAILPDRSKPYARAIIDAAIDRDVSPFLMWAIMDHESRSGTALGYTPAGPTGVGEAIPRWVSESRLSTSYAFARRMGLLTGKTRKNTAGNTEYEVKAPKMPGAPREAWGYGLMQIDYASFPEFIESGKWRDATENIRQGAEVLRQKMRFFMLNGGGGSDPRPLTGDALMKAAVAAYNTGEGNVLNSLKAKADIDRTTYTKDYSRKRWADAASAASKFEQSLTA